MKRRSSLRIRIAVLAALAGGCEAATRYEILSAFFDGVPPPGSVEPAAPGSLVAGARAAGRARDAVRGVHGPYGAKLCYSCHASPADNSLVAPRRELCFRCHDLDLDRRRYVHGPLASGDCTVCHDPHSSRYRYGLVSESETVCLHCHDRDAVARVSAHQDTTEACTTCHDAHGSNKRFLLR